MTERLLVNIEGRDIYHKVCMKCCFSLTVYVEDIIFFSVGCHYIPNWPFSFSAGNKLEKKKNYFFYSDNMFLRIKAMSTKCYAGYAGCFFFFF